MNPDPCRDPHRAKKNRGMEIQLYTQLIVSNAFQFLSLHRAF